MEIPKFIDRLIDRRVKLAEQLDTVCGELDDWLDRRNIETDLADTHTGVEIYANPQGSAERIRQAIRQAPERIKKQEGGDNGGN